MDRLHTTHHVGIGVLVSLALVGCSAHASVSHGSTSRRQATPEMESAQTDTDDDREEAVRTRQLRRDHHSREVDADESQRAEDSRQAAHEDAPASADDDRDRAHDADRAEKDQKHSAKDAKRADKAEDRGNDKDSGTDGNGKQPKHALGEKPGAKHAKKPDDRAQGDDDSDKGKKAAKSSKPGDDKKIASSDHDRGHGNDADGVDEDNPGKSKKKK